MKRIYLCFLWLLVCFVLPLQGQAISQSELLDTARFQHIDSTVDSGSGRWENILILHPLDL